MGTFHHVAAALVLLMSAVLPQETYAQGASPELLRIRGATIGATDLAKTEAWYTQWLDQKVRERGTIGAELAASWGTPNTAGRPFILMSTDAHPDVFIRAVSVDPVPGYRALTTWGWNAIEIIIDDIDTLYARLKNAPFQFIGQPASLGVRYPTIHAMQVKGPSEEVLYLTTEKGDRAKSNLPLPGALVGRPFIMVVAGPNIETMRSWYANTFHMARQPINPSLATLSRTAQAAPADSVYTISLLSMAQHGNMLQLDGFPNGPKARPNAPGQLPPGVAMTSFDVKNLDALKLKYMAAPQKLGGAAYGKARVATVTGTAGELIELIEAK